MRLPFPFAIRKDKKWIIYLDFLQLKSKMLIQENESNIQLMQTKNKNIWTRKNYKIAQMSKILFKTSQC